jgi:hypothetical protein
MTYFASDYQGPYVLRRRVTIPEIATDNDNRCCCMPGYRAKIPSFGYQLTYNDYPFRNIEMSNGRWPMYANTN